MVERLYDGIKKVALFESQNDGAAYNDANPVPVGIKESITIPVSGVPQLTVTNAIDSTAFDLQASAFSASSSITNDYILDNIKLNFSTTESKTITVTGPDGAKLYEDTNTNRNVVIPFNLAINANENFTVAITQFSSPGTADVIAVVKEGSATLAGNPVLGEGNNKIGKVELLSQTTAFGELSVSEMSPQVQIQFPYNINSELVVSKENNSGTVTQADNLAKVNSGASANSSAVLFSRVAAPYHPGQGAAILFTALFPEAGIANNNRYAGVGDAADGFFFGFNGATFGINRRSGGQIEIRTLTITTASTTAENITITLNGDAKADVAVTNTGNLTLTANEIAAADYSDIGDGWDAHAVGDTIVFTSWTAGSKASTYSLSSATTAVGTFAQTVAGVSATDTFVAQTSWSEDQADGTGTLPVLDQTKGNVFKIQYQWLGFGAMKFFIENPSTGKLIHVHTIEYANANTVPSVNNPTLRLCASSVNSSNTSNVSVHIGSMGAFTEGKTNGAIIHHAAMVSGSIATTTETPILTIRNDTVHGSKPNRVRIKLIYASISVDASKPVTVRYKSGATLTDASFSDIETGISVIQSDTSATAISGGDIAFAIGLSKSGGEVFPLSDASIILAPGDTLTITLQPQSAPATDFVASFNWEELF